MVRGQVRGWLMHYISESPHKDTSARIYVCILVCDSLSPENRVNSNCWLIQDEKFWILKESCSQRHPALLTTTATSKINLFLANKASLCTPFSRGGLWVGTNLPDDTVENN